MNEIRNDGNNSLNVNKINTKYIFTILNIKYKLLEVYVNERTK